MAKILTFGLQRKPAQRPRRTQPAPVGTFPEAFARTTSRFDWSEATAEDEYAAALAAYDMLCDRPAARRSMRAA